MSDSYDGRRRRVRWAVLAPGLAALCLLSLFALLTAAPQPALAAPVTRDRAAPSSDIYTAYLPLAINAFATELYPNDPHLDREWGLEKVRASRAWGLSCGCPTALIAVLDSGVDLDHPDMAGKLRTDIDRNFVDENNPNTADDDRGHGTHVAGIAAAATDNSTGVAGLGWETTILPLKVLRADGYGDSTTLAEAIRYAAEQGAQVINMSLGGLAACPSSLQEAVNYAYQSGVVLVAAAGNHGDPTDNGDVFPANCEHVLGVAATEPNDAVAGYSNYGNHVNVAAPGSEIYSTGWPGDFLTDCSSGYCYKWGTSMATPHVAGLAALIQTRYPAYTPDQVASAILDNAVDLGAAGWDPYYGCGRIDAHESLLVGAHSAYPVCLGTQTWSAEASESEVTAPFAAGEVLVSFRPGARVEGVALRMGARPEFLPGAKIWRLQVPAGQEQVTLARLRADPGVAYAELNYLIAEW